jgi:5-methylcytosine-specific restriction endonuclease McrA
VRKIEWKLIEMPLPRLQVMGAVSAPLIYDIGWNVSVSRPAVRRYQEGDPAAFDNRIRLRPQVGEYLLLLNGLLRPLVQRKWAQMVAQLNALEESRLEEFLFGEDRARTAVLRGNLWEMQERRCFYCGDTVRQLTDSRVDHFVPWARYPDNGLENFVMADERCNRDKYSFLAAAPHVSEWAARFLSGTREAEQLVSVSRRVRWERHPERTVGVARAIYLSAPGRRQAVGPRAGVRGRGARRSGSPGSAHVAAAARSAHRAGWTGP